MHNVRSLVLIGAAAVLLAGVSAQAQDKSIRIPIPKHSKATPVQQLNRDGVKAIEKHDYEHAKRLFYKAYLIDPNDPFTLNNLGYISELEGNVDRAQRYYSLAAEHGTDATVDASNSASVEGKPVSKVAGNAAETGMEINRLNVSAIGLLLKDRAPEADLMLQKALALDSKNPFTLNNLGYAKEKEGELETAMAYYTGAANIGSSEPVVVTVNREWRGKPISEIAGDNAKKLRKLLKKAETPGARVARLNLDGVSAMNRNDRSAARRFFEQAYQIDPNDSFTLNNMGYLAEMQGDRESADFYYDKAREAKRSNAKVDVATRRDVEGKKIGDVAETTDVQVQQRIEAVRQAREREGGPVELKRRDGTPVTEPAKPSNQQQGQPNQGPAQNPPGSNSQTPPPTSPVPPK